MKISDVHREKDVILIVDDEAAIRSQLKWALVNDYQVFEAGSIHESLKLVERETPNLVTLDVTLSSNGDLDGLTILEKIISLDSKIKVIMITGHDEKDIALKAINLGAYDYYQKPIEIEELKTIVRRALYIQQLELENEFLSRQLQSEKQFEEIIGDSPEMHVVFDMMRRVSSTDVPVLIYGESGTGKELVARAIHFQSARKDQPFVPINCGAIPENLLESELFGHEKGSFTGAYVQKKGKFELANQGTAFLDEIGELSPALQVKLLRFLQEKEIERVGGKEPVKVDVRILAATNKNLEKEIETESFRSDLFYRLSVITIALPPLRDRGDDILLLANRFLYKYTKEYDRKKLSFDALATKKMMDYQWYGNVRELENRIRRSVIMSKNRLITCEDLGLKDEVPTKRASLSEAINEAQRKYVKIALNQAKGNISQASRELGISRVKIYELIEKYKIEMALYR